MSLGWRYSASGHLTAGAFTQLAGEPTLLLSSLGRNAKALSTSGRTLWSARALAPVYALAALDGNRVATGDDAGHVSLLDAQGRRIWRISLGSRVTALEGIWQEGLLAGGWDERLSLLNLGDGEERVRWQVAVDGPVSDITTLPGLALVATLNGEVSGIDPQGEVLWRYEAGMPITSLGARADAEGELVLAGGRCTGQSRASQVSSHDGSTQGSGPSCAQPQGTVQDGRLLALDSGGNLLWQWSMGAETSGAPVWHLAEFRAGGDAAIVVGLGGEQPQLAMLTSNGDLLWRVGLPSMVTAVTSLDFDGDGEQEILAGMSSGGIRAFDGQGRLRSAAHAGLPVSHIVPSGDSALVLADVVAWRLQGNPGPSGGPWLPAPPMMPADAEPGVPGGDEEGMATLVFLGDVSPGRSMEAKLARHGPAYPWSGLAPLTHNADLTVANLEGVLTRQGRPRDKSYLIRAHPRWGQTLVEAGLDLAHLANNHALDYGPAGLDETLDTLDGLGIGVVGAGRTEQEARRPAVYTLNGVRVAVLGYAAARWNGSADVPQTDRVAWAYPAAVQADVRAVRDEVDVVVVILHAGTEYAPKPSADQVRVAHAAIDAGASLVVGHHPHVVQTVERYGDGLIVYSLGDALFDIPRAAATRGHLLRVQVTPQGVARAELWPFWIEDFIVPRLLDDGNGAPRVRGIYP